MTYRIDPSTRRLIVTDLTPSHKDKTTRVHGVGDGTVVGSNEFDDYKREQEEEDELRDLETAFNTMIASARRSSSRDSLANYSRRYSDCR